MYKVFLCADGLEQQALGRRLYSWHFYVLQEDDLPPDNAIQIAEFEAQLPAVEQCIPPVLAKFKDSEARIQAEACVALKEIQDRRNDLLTLSFSPVA